MHLKTPAVKHSNKEPPANFELSSTVVVVKDFSTISNNPDAWKMAQEFYKEISRKLVESGMGVVFDEGKNFTKADRRARFMVIHGASNKPHHTAPWTKVVVLKTAASGLPESASPEQKLAMSFQLSTEDNEALAAINQAG